MTDPDKLQRGMYKDKTVPPDTSSDLGAEVPLTKVQATDAGDGILLIIATKNADKVKLLQDTISRKVPGKIVLVESVTADSAVGEQPYNEMGGIGARNRTNSAISRSGVLKDEDKLKKAKIGTVLVATVENYVRLKGDSAVDYGYVLIHNATTGLSDRSVSEGVPFPQKYVNIAQAAGFEDDAHLQGKVTVGSVMAERYADEGMKKADPHEFLCGRSRYDILRDAIEGLKLSSF